MHKEYALLAEGRQPVTFGGWSRVRHLRAWLVTTHSGVPGAPPGGTTAAREEFADGRGANASTKSAARDAKMPRWSAERRAGRRHRPVISGEPEIGPTARRATGCGASAPSACRRSASPRFQGSEIGTTAYPRRKQ